MSETPRHVSYADAGVDVDEGARAVDLICAVVEDNGASVKELGNE